jgi:hypothetical protein
MYMDQMVYIIDRNVRAATACALVRKGKFLKGTLFDINIAAPSRAVECEEKAVYPFGGVTVFPPR